MLNAPISIIVLEAINIRKVNQEDKELLFKDLCARLPYGVILNVVYYDVQDDNELTERDITLTTGNIDYCRPYRKSHWVSYKPYLRSMRSMTEEEKVIYNDFNLILVGYTSRGLECADLFDWLNAHHFDYRGLIEQGLAIEVTKDNNPYLTLL